MSAALGARPCTSCGQTLPTSSFGVNRVVRSGLSQACKPCVRAKQRAYLAKKTPDELLRIKRRERAWASANPEKVRGYYDSEVKKLAYAADSRTITKRLEKANRKKDRAELAGIEAGQRATLKREAAPRLTALRKDKRRARQNLARRGHPCVHERRVKKVAWASWGDFKPVYGASRELTRVTGIAHNVDHIYPILSATVCGLHTPDNMRVVTRSENLKKGGKLPGFRKAELWDSDGQDVYHFTL